MTNVRNEILINKLKPDVIKFIETWKTSEDFEDDAEKNEKIFEELRAFSKNSDSELNNNYKMFIPYDPTGGIFLEQLENCFFECIQLVVNTSDIKKKTYDWYKTKENGCWFNYAKYIENVKGISVEDIANMDYTTTKIMNSIENPTLDTEISQKGLVIGDIQSGKTAHFTGLIAKALDSNFDIIIVLAGVHNELRNQTQKRIEDNLIGRTSSTIDESRSHEDIGIKLMNPLYESKCVMLTSYEDDLSSSLKTDIDSLSSDNTAIFVTKKNVNTLKNLFKMLNALTNKNKSILIIDDEADNASIDTNYANVEKNSTIINSKIRDILNIFSKNYFISYTATPYANLFIDKEIDNLYPSDFIIRIPSSRYYTGYSKFFDSGYKHNIIKELENDENNLEAAIKDYLVGSAIKFLMYNDNKRFPTFNFLHSTMLVHSSHLIDEHQQQGQEVSDYLAKIKSQLLFRENHELIDEFSYLFSIKADTYRKVDNNLFEIKFEEVLFELKSILQNDKIKIVLHNSGTPMDERLKYDDVYRHYIVIGGNTLSRGLTLEGLIVSFFERVSKQMDTLSQMGRWFGYRDPYLFLTNVYISNEALIFLKNIHEADTLLIEQLDEMNSKGFTPDEFEINISKYGSLVPTSRNKLGNARTTKFSFTEEAPQITGLDISKFELNKKLIEELFEHETEIQRLSEGFALNNIDSQKIIDFLLNYKQINCNEDLYSKRTDPERWASYIIEKNTLSELVNWKVVLKGKIKSSASEDFSFGTINFSMRNSKYVSVEIRRAKIITSPNDEFYDLENTEKTDRKLARKTRAPEDGLLVIYCITCKEDQEKATTLMISFPKSPTENPEETEVLSN